MDAVEKAFLVEALKGFNSQLYKTEFCSELYTENKRFTVSATSPSLFKNLMLLLGKTFFYKSLFETTKKQFQSKTLRNHIPRPSTPLANYAVACSALNFHNSISFFHFPGRDMERFHRNPSQKRSKPAGMHRSRFD